MTTQQAKHVWDAVLGELQLQVTRPSYETWLKGTVGVAFEDGEFVVGAPNAFVAEMLEQRMYSLISQAMERVTKRRVDVRFQVLTQGLGTGDWGLGDDSPVPSPQSPVPIPQSPRRAALNPRYTFDAFIVGKSNELAHAAALAVSERPGVTYNPLVMYSDVGLGKTHLLHAIGHRVQAGGLSLIYATTEDFTNEYIKAIREGKTEEFRDRYRSADALLLDDIQFLIGKEQTQEGFFHTFNALHMANRQIVITSDRPVTALTLLEDRIQSRLAGGLVVDIQPPDIETRVAILRAKAELMKQEASPEVIQFLAERIHKNIRELEGSFNRVVAYAQLTQRPINLELVKQAIADAISSASAKQVSEDAVLEAVSSYFRIERDELKGQRRDKKTALARQVAMYLLREEANLGLAAIGRVLGGKDHSTVLHGCETIKSKINVDAGLRRDVLNIRETLANS
jgi:chromosomal replication initiator protein